MSWKASLSRHLPVLRFFACRESPASRGVISWYSDNYEELKMLNPCMPLMMRTTENAFPAVATELDFSVNDVLKYMLQKDLLVDAHGNTAQDKVEAAKAYLQTDWALLRRERWASPGFDPEKPFLSEDFPDWREDPKIAQDLALYLELKSAADEQLATVQDAGGDYERAENSLLMMQRVDLWCAGPSEVERAVQHLLVLGKKVNRLEPDYPEQIVEFYPGAADL